MGTPASSTTKAGHHDIAEILLQVALNTINQIKSIPINRINLTTFSACSKVVTEYPMSYGMNC
jgi:hypothetical protein